MVIIGLINQITRRELCPRLMYYVSTSMCDVPVMSFSYRQTDIMIINAHYQYYYIGTLSLFTYINNYYVHSYVCA